MIVNNLQTVKSFLEYDLWLRLPPQSSTSKGYALHRQFEVQELRLPSPGGRHPGVTVGGSFG